MPEEAGHLVAHKDGADVHDILFSTVVLLLAETRLVKLADRFMSYHFYFLFLKFYFIFLDCSSLRLHVISSTKVPNGTSAKVPILH